MQLKFPYLVRLIKKLRGRKERGREVFKKHLQTALLETNLIKANGGIQGRLACLWLNLTNRTAVRKLAPKFLERAVKASREKKKRGKSKTYHTVKLI